MISIFLLAMSHRDLQTFDGLPEGWSSRRRNMATIVRR
jgi:hypothetical protein